MNDLPRDEDLAQALDEIVRRILGAGESAEAVAADRAARDAVRRAEFDRRIALLQAEIDECNHIMASCAPMDKVH